MNQQKRTQIRIQNKRDSTNRVSKNSKAIQKAAPAKPDLLKANNDIIEGLEKLKKKH